MVREMEVRHEYHSAAKYLHGALILLIAIQFVTAWTMPGVRRGSVSSLVNTHMSFGVVILPFALLLLGMRFFRPVHKGEMETPGLQERTAIAVHYLLYALLILVPFSGWAYASSRGITVSLFGVFDLPQIFTNGSSFGRALGGLHGALATLIGFIVLIHAAAALYHHVLLKDSVLTRMIPIPLKRQ